MRKLSIEMDGYHLTPTQAITQSDYINVAFLGVDTAESFTVPAKASIVLFSSDSNFYLNTRAAAVIPTGDIIDGSGPEYNPIVRRVSPGDSLSLISPAACIIMLAFYS
jgi:hypothetical protein